jgi:pyridoxal biosynthesis lyase PdxS
MTPSNTQAASNPTLKAYEDDIAAQIREAKAKIEQLEAKAREKGAQGTTAVVNSLKAAKQNIEGKLQELKTTQDSNLARAKADIETDVARFKASIGELTEKLKTESAKK